MHVWRVETVYGIGPYHWGDTRERQPIVHSGYFPDPVTDVEACNMELWGWLNEGLFVVGKGRCDTERAHPSATLFCGMISREALRDAFKVNTSANVELFTITCYEVPPLYVLVLPSQVLFDKRFATILSREMFV